MPSKSGASITSEPCASHPEPDHTGSTPPLALVCRRTGDGTLPTEPISRTFPTRATLDAPSPNEPKPYPYPSPEHDHELIDYLVRKAIEMCMPPRRSELGPREREMANVRRNRSDSENT